eukprot:GHRQ01026639.1.p1 GENE.GHRQ01026639.1~~GHRQ01026639.1.p1  ORF type:complete len:111 (-),score=18.78 GHRQ01026639.1:236-568(-)
MTMPMATSCAQVPVMKNQLSSDSARICVKTPAMTSTASPHCHMGGAASPSACCRLCVAARCKITQRVASSEYMMQYTIVRPFLPAAFLPTSPNSTACGTAAYSRVNSEPE